MLLQRSAIALSRRAIVTAPVVAQRNFSLIPAYFRRDGKSAVKTGETTDSTAPVPVKTSVAFKDVQSMEDLLPPGAEPGTVPTDMEQATGLERLEILGKMQGVDVFDMTPLDSSRTGTMDNPIVVKSFGDEQFCGCTGCPADSHSVLWIRTSRERPLERCRECGSVYKLEYVGPPDDPHDHHVGYEDPKTFVDYIKPEYWYGAHDFPGGSGPNNLPKQAQKGA